MPGNEERQQTQVLGDPEAQRCLRAKTDIRWGHPFRGRIATAWAETAHGYNSKAWIELGGVVVGALIYFIQSDGLAVAWQATVWYHPGHSL